MKMGIRLKWLRVRFSDRVLCVQYISEAVTTVSKGMKCLSIYNYYLR
jgi:hypothetical protein